MTISYATRMSGVRPSAIRELLRHGADPEVISFGGGYPDPSLFPATELGEIFQKLLPGAAADTLQYTESRGLPALRAHIARRLTRDGLTCDADDVLVIQGAQQGLDLVAKLVLNAGDTVVTENPTFLGALIAFAPFEPRYAPVRIDDDGMDTDHLEETLTLNPEAKLLYTVPDFQNPTGATLSLERRRRLLDLADRHDLLVIEDSPYRELRYKGTSLPTLRSLDTRGRVVHLGSFSKILAPGLRLGWAVADSEVLEKLSLLKLAADTQCSTLNMAAATAYLDNFDIEAHITRSCAAYKHKRDLALHTLGEVLPPAIRFTRAQGGLFTWLSFPTGFDTAAFMRDTLLPQAKVAYVPGATFFPNAQEPNHARLSFSGVADGTLVHGLTRLGELTRQELGD